MTVDKRTGIVLLIRSLNRGGAERQLASLAMGLDPREFQVTVATFYPGGAIWDELDTVPHVDLVSLDKKGRWDNLAILRRLQALLVERSPAILHCYMAEPSIAGAIAGRRASVPAIVWGVRSSNVDYLKYGWFNWATFRIAALMSGRPTLVVANSEAGRAHHVAEGYPADRVITIPNGVDTDRFHAAPDARAAARARWHARDHDLVVGVVARLDPMKGYEVLLRATASARKRVANLKVVCVGGGDVTYARRLAAEATRLGLDDVLVWAGEIDRCESVYPAFDLGCSTSVFGEGFSNAVSEAMACELPCVVTDVGDSAAIVADTGTVVPPSDPEAVAEAIVRFAMRSPAERQAAGARSRQRIVSEFSLQMMIDRTTSVYRELALRSPGRRVQDSRRPAGGPTT